MVHRRTVIAILIGLSGFIFLLSLIFLGSAIIDDPREERRDGDPPIPVALLFLLLIFSIGLFSGLAMVWYYFPEIREKVRNQTINPNASPLEVILFVSTSDEVKVIEAVKTLGNRAYQFEIARVGDLSRMKVHRVIKRLADRDILYSTKEGKHSRIFLSNWLLSDNKKG